MNSLKKFGRVVFRFFSLAVGYVILVPALWVIVFIEDRIRED